MAATLLAIAVWLCIPKTYTAITKIADEYKEMDLALGLNTANVMVRDMMGAANNGLNNIEVYCKVLKTDDFARDMANTRIPGQKKTYGAYLNQRDTIQAVLDNINYNYSTKKEELTIGFTDHDREIAACMLDSALARLQHIVIRYRQSIAAERLHAASEQLRTTREKYQQAQRHLAQYADTHYKRTSKYESKEAEANEKEVQIAFKEYGKATEEYARQEALTKRALLPFTIVMSNTVPQDSNESLLLYILAFVSVALVITFWYRQYLKRQTVFAYGDYFSPWLITVSIWFSILGLYYILDTDLYPIKEHFYICLALWLPILCICSFMTYNLLPEEETVQTTTFAFNEKIFNFFFFISIVITPIHLHRIVQIAMMFSTDDLMNNLRILALYGDGYGILGHSSIINQALFIVALWAYPRVPMWKIVMVGMACFLNSLAIMEKGTIFLIFICTTIVLLHRRVVRLRSLVIPVGGLLLFFYFFNVLRAGDSNGNTEQDSLMDFIAMYALSPPVAFSQLSEEISSQIGSNTFETIYQYLNRFGFSGFVVKEKLQEFVFVPVSTNVYTILQPFYLDFGYKGVAFFAAVYGVVAGWLYKLFRTGNSTGTALYTYLIYALVLQFYQENIFLSLQFIIELTIFIILFTQQKVKFTLFHQ